MKITAFEAESAMWKKTEAELVERLQTLRQKNDGNLDVIETAKLRGTIAMCKEILAWSEPDQTTLD
jgi:hypothetical protein